MMDVHPQHYIRIIKTKYQMLVCTYSNSMVLGTGDQFQVPYFKRDEGHSEGLGKGSRSSHQQITALEEKFWGWLCLVKSKKNGKAMCVCIYLSIYTYTYMYMYMS